MIAVEYRVLTEFVGYRVGSDGSAWSCWRKGPGATLGETWRLLRPTVDRDGYRRIELRDAEGRRFTRKVCVLVATAFHGPCPDGLECRHLNGNSLDDSQGNLAWGTSIENTNDRREHGTIASGEKHGLSKLTDAEIADLRSLKGTMTQQAAADRFGVSRGYVGQLWSGRRSRGIA
jgi:hypothetical protein